jgi:hypothetical protein
VNRRRPAAPSIAYGLVLAAAAVLTALTVLSRIQVDLSLAVPVAAVAVGAVLLVGGVVSGLRRGSDDVQRFEPLDPSGPVER